MKILRTAWLSLCGLMNDAVVNKRELREKAIMVAGRVSIVEDANSLKACCPVCLEAMCTPLDSDLKMILAVHMNLWHPEDVALQWEMMNNKKKSIVHVPSFLLGVGLSAGIGFLLSFIEKDQTRDSVNKDQKVAFKWK